MSRAAHVAGGIELPAIHITRHAEFKLQVVFFLFISRKVIDQHACIFYTHFRLAIVSLDGILDRARHLLLLLVKEFHLFQHGWLSESEGKYFSSILHGMQN